jgi:hypothetical protein
VRPGALGHRSLGYDSRDCGVDPPVHFGGLIDFSPL